MLIEELSFSDLELTAEHLRGDIHRAGEDPILFICALTHWSHSWNTIVLPRMEKDADFRRSLSPTAQKACDIVRRIRSEEQNTIWRQVCNDEGGEEELYPGMMFMLAKRRMESTKLWKIACRMPKGALLHCHMSAMVDLGWLYEKTLATPGMYFYSTVPLHSESNRRTAAVRFTYSSAVPKASASVWKSGYEPGTLIDANAAADSFPDGGRKGFISWLKDRTSIVAKDSIEHHLGVDAIWRKFTSAFVTLGSITYYEPILRAFIQKLLETIAKDGVQWVEFRDAFTEPYWREHEDAPCGDFSEMVRAIGEEIEKFKATKLGENFWGGRIIWTGIRSMGTEQIIQNMQNCILAKKAHPHLIAGFDLVGQEDMGRTLKDLTPELIWFRQKCIEEKLEIPFFFHAGECLGDGDGTDENLYDAILLRTRRIGHAFSLYKHPDLIDLVKEKKILIESCPISNEVLRLTATVLAHPLPALLARGVPASLSNDDPALLGQGTSGMSHDFWSALQGWENLGLAGLGSLAENSVRWGIYEDQTEDEWLQDIELGINGSGIRAERIKRWQESWEGFCQWIVDEYGD
ncbi:adenosine deaminase [Histoplasma capsulatum G186AR]|uniref:adenosine deaminase n=1 Tax=Ajellomyces capsulatus (strain G186AR / H82 / ATCC MYA-2454 / RMSCC 2432) TaxID=447093 RepID=C0NVG2_AJECG|nr:adenosine deaminase [Histoplasma capsulatum G186AR]EEH04501.1 adenosine deaminase [Histoplasma capsulatum G186AR]